MKELEILTEYKASVENDALLLQWYAVLVETKAINDLLNIRSRTLSGFFATMQNLHLLIRADDKGIWYAAIITPIFAGAEFDMWVREDKRGNREWLESMFEALEFGFDRYGTLIGMTAQEKLLDGHRKIGYSVVGMVPKLWDGDRDLWLMYITRESFEAREARVRRVANG